MLFAYYFFELKHEAELPKLYKIFEFICHQYCLESYLLE